MSDEVRDVYCARQPGWPGFVAVVVDLSTEGKQRAKWTADALRDWVRDGLEIAGKFTRAESVAGLNEYNAERKRRDAEKPSASATALIACRRDGADRRNRERAAYERAMRGEA